MTRRTGMVLLPVLFSVFAGWKNVVSIKVLYFVTYIDRHFSIQYKHCGHFNQCTTKGFTLSEHNGSSIHTTMKYVLSCHRNLLMCQYKSFGFFS